MIVVAVVVFVAIIIILRLQAQTPTHTEATTNNMHVDFALPRRCQCFELYSGQLQIH